MGSGGCEMLENRKISINSKSWGGKLNASKDGDKRWGWGEAAGEYYVIPKRKRQFGGENIEDQAANAWRTA